MFYTLTANPAVDMTVSSSPLEPDENVRTGSASYTANGKGLDVSFAFKKMGVDTVALGFFARLHGQVHRRGGHEPGLPLPPGLDRRYHAH